jgi:hypothetical protein
MNSIMDRSLFDPPAIVRPAEDLAVLAAQINHEHAQAEAALRSSLGHARAAGELLAQAKGRCGHGAWLPWLREHVRFSERTAQGYMRIAREWDRLQANPQPVADLTYREALQMLARPAGGDGADTVPGRPAYRKPLGEWGEADRHATVARWPDLLTSYTLLLDCRGWEPGRIADFLGRTPREIGLILDPRPPVRFDTAQNGAGLVEPWETQRQLEQDYRDEVTARIAWLHHFAYLHAMHHAECEGWPEAGAEMEAMARRAYHLVRRVGSPVLTAGWGEEQLLFALSCCADDDALAAVGQRPARDSLLPMLGEYLEVVLPQDGDGEDPA